MTFFDDLMGFPETDGETIRSQIQVDGTTLTSLDNGRTFEAGELSTPSLHELRQHELPSGGQLTVIYEFDRTQGPACAIACGAGTIFRNWLVPLDGHLVTQAYCSAVERSVTRRRGSSTRCHELWRLSPRSISTWQSSATARPPQRLARCCADATNRGHQSPLSSARPGAVDRATELGHGVGLIIGGTSSWPLPGR